MDSDFKAFLQAKCESYLNKLCNEITERTVGTDGNVRATRFFMDELKNLGFDIDALEFTAMDWIDGGAKMSCENNHFDVLVSPYSSGCELTAELTEASTIEKLEKLDCSGKILLLHGDLAKEQLMPKNFVFYNPDEHKRIISRLENSGAKALVCATGHNGAFAGGVYPFPLIEDGDFNVPSVFMTDKEGEKLKNFIGKQVTLHSISKRIQGKGYNVSGKTGMCNSERIVVSAHIDAKKGSSGAIDNATGVAVLMLLAQILQKKPVKKGVELAAFNGEDYYAVSGQMAYINANQNSFENVILNINIDGAGYKTGKTAFSFFNLPSQMQTIALQVLKNNPELTEGIQWPQGDHSIFLQYGIPAIAVSSEWFINNIEQQDITHTPKDNLSIVDINKVVDIAVAIWDFVSRL